MLTNTIYKQLKKENAIYSKTNFEIMNHFLKGGGTTLHEAIRSGANVIGIDIVILSKNMWKWEVKHIRIAGEFKPEYTQGLKIWKIFTQ